jgi:hypothetical protein
VVKRFLHPDEKVLWWIGPRETPWQEWVGDHVPVLFGIGFTGFFVLPFLGMGLCYLLHLPPGAGFFFGGILGGASMTLGGALAGPAEKRTWHVITTGRLLVIQGRKKTQDHDLAFLRRFLATLPANAESAPRQSEGITDLASILAMARSLEQMQAIHTGDRV